MTQIPYTLRTMAGEEETRVGGRLFRAGRVRIAEQSAKMLRCQVVEEGRYEVTFTPDGNGKCACVTYQENGACRHVVAAMMACQEAGALDEMLRRKASASGPKLMAAMDKALPEEGTLRMGVRLIADPVPTSEPPRLKLVLLIGEERLYVVKSIPQLIEAIDNGTTIEFGKGFTFHPEWMRFGPVENRILASCGACAWPRRRAASPCAAPSSANWPCPTPLPRPS